MKLNFHASPVVRRLKPFPYQNDFDVAVKKAFADGFKKVLCVLPTGGGKTFCAGEQIAQRVEKGKRCLTLAHTRKLVHQFKNSVEDQFGIEGSVESGDSRSTKTPLVVSTIQSMQKRINSGKFRPDEFDLIVVDEAHRILSPGYAEALKHFKADVIGLTATPRRGDQKCLMTCFDTKAIDIPLNRLIDEGFLAPLTIINFPLKIELKGASKTGDFSEEEVAHAIEPYLESCADELVKHKGRCMLVFLPLIKTSKMFTQMLINRGMKAEHVDGEMGLKETDLVKHRLEKGDIEVVCNSMLYTEGIDIRPVNLILNLRPTRSWTLYTQCCGRGTRTFDPLINGVKDTIWPVKTDCILLDPLWQCDQHSLLQRPASLVATSDDEAEEMDKKFKEMESADDFDGEIDLLDVKKAVANDREEALRERLKKLADRKRRQVSAMDLFLSMGRLDLAEYEPMAKWEMEKMTDGQRATLINNGIDLDTIKDKGHASKVIEAIIERIQKGMCSIKMAKYAQSFGLENAMDLPYNFVSDYIAKAKAGKLPNDLPE